MFKRIKEIVFGEHGETAPMKFTARNRAAKRHERLVQVSINLTLDMEENSNIVKVLRESDIDIVMPEGSKLVDAELARIEIRK
tara:strand:- start:5807 stop:6055 length:249 start_codon:yes stop_codon:yes gene_type:complete